MSFIASISATATSLAATKQLCQALLELRDFNQVATAVAQINGELLKAQESLFAHQAHLLQLQEEHFHAREELRKLKEAIAERGRYSLVEISDRVFAYRVNVTPQGSASDNPSAAEPVHHLCQPCFDRGVKAVLKKFHHVGLISLACPICNVKFATGETTPVPQRRAYQGTPGW
jgi:hypothetical protein